MQPELRTVANASLSLFPAPRILPSLSRARVSTFLGYVLFAEARQSCVSGRRRNETEQRVFVKCLNKMFVVSCGRRQGQIKCDALTQPDCQYSECVCSPADRYSQRRGQRGEEWM